MPTKSEARLAMQELISDMQDRDWRTSTEPYDVNREVWVTFCPHKRDCGHGIGDMLDFDLQFDPRDDRYALVRIDGMVIGLESSEDECPSIYTIEEAIAGYLGDAPPAPAAPPDFIDFTSL